VNATQGSLSTSRTPTPIKHINPESKDDYKFRTNIIKILDTRYEFNQGQHFVGIVYYPQYSLMELAERIQKL